MDIRRRDIDVLWTRGGGGGVDSKFHISLIHKNSIFHSYTNIQRVMDILMCCGQGGDNSKFHISLIHKHSDSYGYIDVL